MRLGGEMTSQGHRAVSDIVRTQPPPLWYFLHQRTSVLPLQCLNFFNITSFWLCLIMYTSICFLKCFKYKQYSPHPSPQKCVTNMHLSRFAWLNLVNVTQSFLLPKPLGGRPWRPNAPLSSRSSQEWMSTRCLLGLQTAKGQSTSSLVLNLCSW